MAWKVATIVGTRPEAIKMAPVIKGLQAARWCDCVVVATAQHRQLLDQVFELFDISIDVDLNIMQEAQSLAGLTSRLFERLDGVYADLKPDIVVAQGDTTTVMVAAIAAFYRRIPFAHVEAGLRTGDFDNPFPEEFNRTIAGKLAKLHFAPTETARQALLRENVPDETIFVTGNTVIDALHWVAAKNFDPPVRISDDHRLILMTAHRRENFGEPMKRIFTAVRKLLERHPDVEIVFPVHPNPMVRKLAAEQLAGTDRLHLIDPVNYQGLVSLLKRCTFVLTDSGGLQEEAPALNKPVLVMREETERPEAIEAGVSKLIGTCTETILREASLLLHDRAAYESMTSTMASPFGDGHATERIIRILEGYLKQATGSFNHTAKLPAAAL